MHVQLGPEAGPAERAAVDGALASAGLGAGSSSPWWRAGLVDALERAPSDLPLPQAYEATRSPRSTLGATRA